MKEMKIDFNSEMVQECGRVPVFNEKNASILHTIVAIPFGKKCEPKDLSIPYDSIPDDDCWNSIPDGDCCGCSRPNAGDLLERLMVGFEERHKVADPALIKAIFRHQPVKPTRELYELVELKVD